MRVIHTVQCLDHQIHILQLQKDFLQKYPNFCRTCDGAGGKYDPGTRWDPPNFDTCPDCIDKGKCPLCMKGVAEGDTDEVVCTECGYNFNEEGTPVYPQIEEDCECGFPRERRSILDIIQEFEKSNPVEDLDEGFMHKAEEDYRAGKHFRRR